VIGRTFRDLRVVVSDQIEDADPRACPDPGAAGMKCQDLTPPLVSVLMPTHAHAHFICRAIESMLAQTLTHWELVIVDDASPDDTASAVRRYLGDPRIRYERLSRNVGLGAALNCGMDIAHGRLIAYLPSDDVLYAGHLHSLHECLAAHPHAALAFSGVRHHSTRCATGVIDGRPLQLVQVMHRRTTERWAERDEVVTDDLGRMLWERLQAAGAFVGSGAVTCEWVDHPDQLHKLLREPEGGINLYRQRYGLRQPLRFHTTAGNCIDEVALYARYRGRPHTPPAADGLKILLVGELARNPDRVLALEEMGHRLYGLWMRRPYWYNAVGPLPFGHVQDIPFERWRESVRRLQPDVIYALLNWQAVPFAYEVMRANPGLPFVWHFKEGPFICLEKGTWQELVSLYRLSDGRIYSSPEMRDWFESVAPGLDGPAMVLDGDLPKRDWLDAQRSPRLSQQDGMQHTVVPGRPIGLHPQTVAELGRQGIHLHFYGDLTQGQWREWIAKAQHLAPHTLHLHAQVDQNRWVEELSRYDAGWLHVFRSQNQGELRRANWDDLNYPARLATLAAAGLPLLQRDNSGAVVATQSLARALDIGVFFEDMSHLGAQLLDTARLDAVRDNMWRQREVFTFDHHVQRLVAFFRDVIALRSKVPARQRGRVLPLNPVPAPLHVGSASAGAAIPLTFPAPSAPENQ
jgi:glycosyltransferase involved in cell wall biosynthesis